LSISVENNLSNGNAAFVRAMFFYVSIQSTVLVHWTMVTVHISVYSAALSPSTVARVLLVFCCCRITRPVLTVFFSCALYIISFSWCSRFVLQLMALHIWLQKKRLETIGLVACAVHLLTASLYVQW